MDKRFNPNESGKNVKRKKGENGEMERKDIKTIIKNKVPASESARQCLHLGIDLSLVFSISNIELLCLKKPAGLTLVNFKMSFILSKI